MLNRRKLLAGVSLAPVFGLAHAASVVPPPEPTLRQSGGRPLWQPVTNRNGTCGGLGGAALTAPDTVSRVNKTIQVDCSEIRTVFTGFQMLPVERPLLSGAGITGAYAAVTASVATAGSGYTSGDILIFASTASDLAAVTLRVTRLGASGAIAEVEVVDRGALKIPIADGLSPTTATKRGGGVSAGSGASFAFAWQEYALGINFGFEPVADPSGSIIGPGAIIKAGVGLRYDGSGPQTAILVPDGGIVVTDPIRVPLFKGSAIAERFVTIGAPAYCQRRVMGTDYFANGATPDNRAFSGALPGPNANATVATITLGRPSKPAPWFCIVGDSIDFGVVGNGGTAYDSGDASYNSGWVERGLQLAGGFGLISMTRSGDALQYWYSNTNSRFMRLGMLSRLSETVNFGSCVFLVNLAINDITAGVTATNLQTSIRQICQDLMAFNPAGLFYGTCMPGGVTSTDGYASVAGQTVNSTIDANRKTVNTWLRAGAGGLLSGQFGRTRTGIIDRAAAVEANNNGAGVWAPGLTNDGVHPLQTTHATVLAPLVQTLAHSFTLPA